MISNCQGMGTKVHYRSYFPGHGKMRDLNADTRNSWPSFYINKTLNEHLYNGCFPSPLIRYSDYDKEMLKRTMLEHEAIFRKQVYELHRLYGIQKDLMEEFQKNGLSGLSEHKVPSKTISCSSHQSDHATRMRQMSRLCAMNNCQKGKKSTYYEDIIYPVNFPQSNLHSSGLIEIETLQRVAESDDSFRKYPKRMLDFRLPAGACIDDTEKSEEIPGSSSINTSTCSRICTGDSEIELKLNLVSVNGSFGKEDVCKLNYLHNKSLFTGLADLNEPNRQTSLEGAPNLFPVMIFGPKTRTEENHRLNFSLSSTTLNMQNAFTNDGDCGKWTFSNVFQGSKEEISREAVCHKEAGKIFPPSFMNSTSHKEKDPMLCEAVKLNVNMVSDIDSIDHNETSTRFGHERNNHFLISGKCPGHSESSNLGKLTSVLPNSFSNSLKPESNMTSFPLVPTWMKSSDENHASSPLSAISSFDGSSRVKNVCSSDIATKDPNGASGSWQFGIDLTPSLRFEEKFSSPLNGLNVGIQSHSTLQIKCPFTNLNLNVEAENSCSGTQDGPTVQQNKTTKDKDGQCEDLLRKLSWLKRIPACEPLEPSRLPSQVDLGFSKINQVYEKAFEDATTHPSCNFEVFSSSLHERESKIQNNQPSNSLSSTKFVAPNFDKLQQNLLSRSNEEKLVIDELKRVSMSHEIKMYSSEKSTSLENKRRGSMHCIDLNSVFPFEDDPNSSEISAEVQAEASSMHSGPSLASRVVPLIDLETPFMALEEDNVTSDIASTPFSSSVGLQEELCSPEILIREAAENIVKLSLDGFNLKDEIQSSSLSATPPDNALYMFAEMILSNNNSKELNTVSECRRRDDELDLFELMTLQLEEMKPENLWCRQLSMEANERSKASLLLAKPRRAQGKKRRQRKDFQKDILPALATLSRQESMEDLQVIGELLKASGTPWQAGSRRRNHRGISKKAQASRKRRKTVAAEMDPPTALFMVDGNDFNPEYKVGRHRMIGWGRTTRRCRSQRCPSASISSTLI